MAAVSPFFQNILKMTQHPHPFIFNRALKSEDLVAIVDYLYCREANVFQENLDSFLITAEELQLKGLVDQNNGDSKKYTSDSNGFTRKKAKYPWCDVMKTFHILLVTPPANTKANTTLTIPLH